LSSSNLAITVMVSHFWMKETRIRFIEVVGEKKKEVGDPDGSLGDDVKVIQFIIQFKKEVR